MTMCEAGEVTFRLRAQLRVAGTVRRFAADASGTTAMEYALLGALIAVVIAASVSQLGDGVKPLYEQLVGIYVN
jgi:pilus assembly protein Flp/PilA